MKPDPDHTPAPSTQPPAGWAPTPLSGAPRPETTVPVRGGSPSAPLGGAELPTTKIDEFAAPRSWWPVIVAVVAVLAAVLIWASTTLRPAVPSATKPSPTPSATESGPGLPFVSPNERYAGRWEILRYEWTADGVELQIRIAVEKGPLAYSFIAFENSSVTATDPRPGSHTPRFTGFPIETGDEETGWLFFPLQRGEATVILANAGGHQMSALPIPG